MEIRDSLGPIKVFDNRNARHLTFGSSYEQSSQKRADPGFLMHEHTRAMVLPLVFEKLERVTVLGLGGGSLVNCLYHRFPSLQLQAVERRQAVIDIAYDYFQLPRAPRLSIRCQDAFEFAQSAAPGNVDFLLCDLFNADGLDSTQSHRDFLYNCYEMLSHNGWAAFNYSEGSAKTQKSIKSLKYYFDSLYTCCFPTGNLIVMVAKKRPTSDRDQLLIRAMDLEKHLGFPIVRHFLRLSLATREKSEPSAPVRLKSREKL